jgi:hypothetical protein
VPNRPDGLIRPASLPQGREQLTQLRQSIRDTPAARERLRRVHRPLQQLADFTVSVLLQLLRQRSLHDQHLARLVIASGPHPGELGPRYFPGNVEGHSDAEG